jgi:hypothetical protein
MITYKSYELGKESCDYYLKDKGRCDNLENCDIIDHHCELETCPVIIESTKTPDEELQYLSGLRD